MPMMPFIGVRISWLMLARNSLLSRPLSSAFSLAAISSVLSVAQLGGADGDLLLQPLTVVGQFPVPLLNLGRASR